MKKEYREKLIKEIARKVDVDMCLDYLITRYNEEFQDLNATKDEFGIRLAKTPEEACYISTIITIPKSEMDMSESDIKEKAKYYDSLIEKAFKDKYDFMKPDKLGNIKSWDELMDLLNWSTKKISYEVIYEEDEREYMTTAEYLTKEEIKRKIEDMIILDQVEVKGVLKTIHEDEFIPLEKFLDVDIY